MQLQCVFNVFFAIFCKNKTINTAMDNCITRIAGLILLIAMLASQLQLAEGQCNFPVMWERTWWVSPAVTTEYTSDVPGQVIITITGLPLNIMCEDFHEPTDQWRYYITDPPDVSQCHRVYHDSNLLVQMTTSYPGLSTPVNPFDASLCADDNLYTTPNPTDVYIDQTPTNNNCFTLLAATYKANLITNVAGGEDCDTDPSSRVVFTDNTVVMDTCSTQSELSASMTYTCLGRISAEYIGQPAGDEVLVLSDESSPNTFYCGRIRKVTDQNVVTMSIDFTPSDGVKCVKVMSAETYIDVGSIQVRAVSLERLFCEPSDGCLSGGTCVEPAVVVVSNDPEAYTCTCVTGFTGHRCETFLYCEDPNRCTLPERGICSEGGDPRGYTCACNNGYEGINCETALICVLNNPCENGATCQEDVGDAVTCDCADGYTGDHCETDLVCVLSDPCQNGATCGEVDGVDVTCDCPNGYMGDLCDTALICVLSDPCQNGATCEEAAGDTVTCICDTGYTGTECEIALICVLLDPCQNGATCSESVDDDVICTCADGYTGDLCETQLVCVLDDPCQNGGTCAEVEGDDTATCECPDGYTGLMCETQLVCVLADPCMNGATCSEIDGADDATCSCADGYTDDRCQTPLVCVLSDPCLNGATCVEVGDGVSSECTCAAGYTDQFCQTSLLCVLSDPCQNGAACEEAAADTVTCICDTGYTGTECEIALVCVLTEPCHNGATCSEGVADDFTCTCADGYTGDLCETELVCVLDDPCQNGGTCAEVEGADTATCDCPDGYTGPMCETQLVCVLADPCMNGATCSEIDGADDATCSCADGYTGDRCQTPLVCVLSDPCLNGATCVEVGDGVSSECTCAAGYTDQFCQTSLVCVLDNTCENGATCREVDGDTVECDCVDGYTGDSCETDLVCVLNDPCENGATCEELDGVEVDCVCAFGYEGDQCETPLVCLLDDPCLNSAPCMEVDGITVNCQCAPGYTGDVCETELYCEPTDPCQNGGTCVESNGGECECPVDYTGDVCQTFLYCSEDPCQNGQPCTEGVGTFVCTCVDPYEGVRCEIDTRCVFPDAWRSVWYLNDNFALNFEENQMHELDSATSTNIIETYNCEDYKESGQPQGVRFYARSNVNELGTETCTRGYQTTFLFLHWEDLTIADAEPPTADFCEATGVFDYPPDIYVKYPFDYTEGACFNTLTGRFEATYSRDSNGQNLCQNDPNSLVIVSDNDIDLSICNEGGSEQFLTQTLECVGTFSSSFIDDPTTDGVVIFHVQGSVDRFYCGRIRYDTNDFRLLLSVDITPSYEQITCLRDISSQSAQSTGAAEIRALNLKQVFCWSTPCMNGATCVEQDGAGFTCECIAGYTGDLCETDIDDCANDPCLNGGTCTDMVNDFSCDCADAYYGDTCQFYNPCIGEAPCQNGGTCSSSSTATYACDCLDNYEGDDCETEIFCYSDPCMNFATCTDLPTTFQCTCPPNFIGDQCETELFCVPDPCENNGVCSEVGPGDGYICDCPNDFEGTDCETRLYCVPDQCQNGATCEEETDDFICTCPPAYIGDLCETRIYCFSDPCLNGGTCEEAANTFECMCPTFPIAYTGDTCETRLYCEPNNPCLNGGTCREDDASGLGYVCSCPSGFSGDNCDIEGDCAFPSSWRGDWYIKDDLYVEFTENKVNYKTSPTGNPISGGSYHCEDYFVSAGVGDWRYYVRSLLNMPQDEFCIQSHHNENLIVHFDDATGVTSDPPTAEECESQGVFDAAPDIMIQYPFDFETTTCFSQYTGQYYAKFSSDFVNQDLCGDEDEYLYSSTVMISDNVMQVNTCFSGTGEPLSGVQLRCVGLLDARYIGDDLTDSIVILAEYSASTSTARIDPPQKFYCGRIRNNMDDMVDPRIYLSIDITARDQLECVTGVTASTARNGIERFRALELMEVFCAVTNLCMNGGTCSENNGIDYSCACAEGYTGSDCETDMDECAASPCEHGGTCEDGPASYTCTCVAGFSGDDCELIDGCENSPCLNGGTCNTVDTAGNFVCACEPGYTGDICQTDIDGCDPNPCANGGACVDELAGYTCTCAQGFDGVDCQLIDGCGNSPCMNDGECTTVDNSGNYECDCGERYTGDRCETEIFCTGVVCQHGGTCAELTAVGDYSCACTDGYDGRHCEDELFCFEDPCQNGATCNEAADECDCDGDWEGAFCDDDGGFDWLIFGIVTGVTGGLVLLGLFIWAICYCARMGAAAPAPITKAPPQSFVQAYPIATPTYIATPAPTIINGSTAHLGAITYTSSPSIYGSQPNVRNGMGVSNPPPQISIRRSKPSGSLPSQYGPSIIPLAPNPSNGILVNRTVESKTEGSLMGQLLDAEFYPDIDV